jgi:hypothetical protein
MFVEKSEDWKDTMGIHQIDLAVHEYLGGKVA